MVAPHVSVSSRPDPSDQLTPCEQFYGLRRHPFSLTPDLRFEFFSRSHARARADVSEALRRREGVIVVTGQIGTGKTMLCRTLLEGFHEGRIFLSVISDPLLTADDLLHQVLCDFGVIARARRDPAAPGGDATRHELVTKLQEFLATLIPLNAHAVIMVDEAQHLDVSVLEQIRLLSNFETDEGKLLQIVLVGQPDLDAVLRRPEMAQLNQRITRRIELHALSESEVADYIARRLTVASSATGSTDSEPALALFTPTAIESIERVSNGVPRIINIVCDRAMEMAFERQAPTVDHEDVLNAANRLKLTVPAAHAASTPVAAALSTKGEADHAPTLTPIEHAGGRKTSTPTWLGAAAALLIVAAGIWWMSRPAQAPVRSPQSTPQSMQTVPAPAPSTPSPAATTPAPPATNQPAQPAPSANPPSAAAAPKAASSSTAGAAGGYRIAVAAFRTSKRAIDVASNIAAKGFPVSTHPDSTGEWYQVVVGPFASANAAAEVQRTLAREGYPDTRITPVTPER